MFVLCNKCDDPKQKPKTNHVKFFQENNIDYYCVSAKTGRGVQEALLDITRKMIKIIPKTK